MEIIVFRSLRDRYASSNMISSALQILCTTQMKNMGEVDDEGHKQIPCGRGKNVTMILVLPAIGRKLWPTRGESVLLSRQPRILE